MTTVLEPPTTPRASAVTEADFARAGATRRKRDSRVKIWAGSICALLVILPVALAGLLPLADPNQTNLSSRRLPPLTDGHLFGTDQLGRDLLSRILHGGQVSLTIGILAVIVSGVIGIVARIRRGVLRWLGRTPVISRLLEAQLSLPLLMMLLLVVALFGPSIPRHHVCHRDRTVARSRTVDSPHWYSSNAKSLRSCSSSPRTYPHGHPASSRHSNIVKQASLVVLLLLAQAVLLESSLSYLVPDRQRPFATWGRIIADGQDYITTSWWIVTLTGLMIVLLVVGREPTRRCSERSSCRFETTGRKPCSGVAAPRKRRRETWEIYYGSTISRSNLSRRTASSEPSTACPSASTPVKPSPSSVNPAPESRRQPWGFSDCFRTILPVLSGESRVQGSGHSRKHEDPERIFAENTSRSSPRTR